MCLGSPEEKARCFFELALGSNYQRGLDILISSGEYGSEEEAADFLSIGWTSNLLEHALR